MLTKKKLILFSAIFIISSMLVIPLISFENNVSPNLIETPSSATVDYQITSVVNQTMTDGRGMHVVDDVLYVMGTNYVDTLNLSDPTNPVAIGSVSTSYGSWGDVYVSGNLAALGKTSLDFILVNVSDLSTPTVSDTFVDGSHCWGVTIDGEYAYQASETDGVEVIDISDPTNVDKVGFYNDTLGLPYDIQIVEDLAYVADWSYGLQILNVSDPENPTKVSETYNNTGQDKAWGIFVQGNYAYLADWQFGLRIFDVSDPSSPTELWHGGRFQSRRVWIVENYAYIVNSNFGFLQVYDISNKLLPDLVAEVQLGGDLYDVEVHDGVIYVVGNSVLYVFEETITPHGYTVTNPDLSTSWETNTTQSIQWTNSGNVSNYVDLELYLGDQFVMSIANNSLNTLSYNWKIPLDLVNGTTYQIKIIDSNDLTASGFSSYFEIYTPSVPPGPKIPGFRISILLGLIGFSVTATILHIRFKKRS